MICNICNKEFKSYQSLSMHIKTSHKLNQKDYYDQYMKKDNEGYCLVCGKPTIYLKLSLGYQKHCSCKCAQNNPNVNLFITNNPQKNPEVKEKTRQTCLQRYGVEHSLSSATVREKSKQTLLEKYGVENIYQLPEIRHKASYNSHTKEANDKRNMSRREHIRQIGQEINATYVQDLLDQTKSSGWFQSGTIDTIKYKGFVFVDNSNIQKVFDYDENTHRAYSGLEKKIVDNIRNNYSGIIIENTKKVISPLELDIYLPELKLAVEFNGTYFHSILANCPKDYHLNKSLLCREKGIRLVHIYEFENIDNQIELVISLINGKDLYNKTDFNKNNLISNIPNPEVVFDDGRLVVYGAGFLK